jgi:cell division protein FtsA
VDAHIVTGSSTAVSNLVQCVMAHGIDVDELVLEPLAANEAVLKPEERRMGVAVVDMGGGTSDLAIFIDNALCHTIIMDMGGNHLTNDLAYALRCPFETAEDLKLRYGSLLPARIAPDDEAVWANGLRREERAQFQPPLYLRGAGSAGHRDAGEDRREARRQRLSGQRLPAGLVLTGGCSQLPGFTDLGRERAQHARARRRAHPPRLPISGLSAHAALAHLRHDRGAAAVGHARRCARGPPPL